MNELKSSRKIRLQKITWKFFFYPVKTVFNKKNYNIYYYNNKWKLHKFNLYKRFRIILTIVIIYNRPEQ